MQMLSSQAMPLRLLADASELAGPIFLNLMLKSVENQDASEKKYALAGAMAAILVIGSLAENHHFQLTTRAGFRIRSMLTAEVQRKILFLSVADRANFSTGQIFNLVATDAETLHDSCLGLLSIVSVVLRLAVATFLLFQQLGVACFVMLAVLASAIPLQAYIIKLSTIAVRFALNETDRRIKLEQELISGTFDVSHSSQE